MTYSILGYDPVTGDLGVAVQSKFPGVGSLVPYGEADVGVVATQAFGNPRHGTIGLQLLRCGATPQQAVEVLLHNDDHGTRRQFALLDSSGDVAAYTGAELQDWDGWSGSACGRDCVALGNGLASVRVVDQMRGREAAGGESRSAVGGGVMRASGRFGSVFGSLRGYRRGWLLADLVAGLAVWAVLVPESLAYAVLAGVPPVVGLWAAPAALVLYAALGSSRHLVVGPMSATAALSGVLVGGLAADAGHAAALTAGLALVTGLLTLGAGLLRLGFLAGFVSQPVLKGFIIGLALTIVAGQLPKLFGVERVDGVFVEKLWGLSTELGHTNGWALAVGASSLVLLLLLRHFVPLLPAAMVAVLAGVLASVLLGLPERGVAVVGSIASGLPPFGLPELRLADYTAIVAGAVGIALVGFAEGLAAAQTYASKAGYDVDPDRELLGVGAANLGAGLCAGMVVSGSLSKTAVNGGAGARSQASGLVVAALTAVTLLVLTGLFERLPEATLGAIVIVAVAELIDVPALRRLYRIRTSRLGAIYGPAARVDFLAALAALLGVLLFDTLPGLFIGIAASVLLLVYRASRPNVAVLGKTAGPDPAWVDLTRHPAAQRAPGVEVVRVEAGLFFANADHVRARIRGIAESADARAVVLDAETSPSIDVTAARMLADLAQNLHRRGTRLLVARDVGQVRDVLRRTEVPGIAVGVHRTVDAAVHAALHDTSAPGAAESHPLNPDDPGTVASPAPTAPDTDDDDAGRSGPLTSP
jgi:high affinity sulfate transporter 1